MEIGMCHLQGSVSVDYQQPATGVTALMCACVGGRVETTKLLLKHRADAQLTDRYGLSATHCAVWGGSLKCVKALAAHSRSVLGLRDQWGRTPLLTAAAKVRRTAILRAEQLGKC